MREDSDDTPRRRMNVNVGVLHNPSFRNDMEHWNGKGPERRDLALRDKLAATYQPSRGTRVVTAKDAYRADYLLKRQAMQVQILWQHELSCDLEVIIMSEVCNLFEERSSALSDRDGRKWFSRNFEEWEELLNRDERTIRRAITRLVRKNLLFRQQFHMKDHGIRSFT